MYATRINSGVILRIAPTTQLKLGVVLMRKQQRNSFIRRVRCERFFNKNSAIAQGGKNEKTINNH